MFSRHYETPEKSGSFSYIYILYLDTQHTHTSIEVFDVFAIPINA